MGKRGRVYESMDALVYLLLDCFVVVYNKWQVH